MEKLLELEKRLREAKAELEKAGGRFTGMQGSVATSGGPSIASQIGFGKKEDDKEDDKKKDKKHMDEKEDKKLIAKEIDKHNEKKHGEPKDEDSAFKKAENKYGNQMEAKRSNIMNEARQPAKVIEGGKTKLVTPDAQVKAKVESAAEKKGKAEAEAAARRMQHRKDGVLKADDMCKSDESLSFNEWGQWNL